MPRVPFWLYQNLPKPSHSCPSVCSALCRLLAPRNPTPVLISSLLVISQLARSTHAHHGAVAASGLVAAMPALLRHGDATVRARSCNLLGNLCRHRWVFVRGLLLPRL